MRVMTSVLPSPVMAAHHLRHHIDLPPRHHVQSHTTVFGSSTQVNLSDLAVQLHQISRHITPPFYITTCTITPIPRLLYPRYQSLVSIRNAMLPYSSLPSRKPNHIPSRCGGGRQFYVVYHHMCRAIYYSPIDVRRPPLGREVYDAAAFWAFSWARELRAERTRGASWIRSAHCFMKSCCVRLAKIRMCRRIRRLTRNKSCALALFSGSTFSAKYKKSLNTGLKACSSLIAGVPLVAIR